VLADTHGSVVVVGTRDCSLQRRHQKLVEEAPAPFLSESQRETIHSSAKAICLEAGYSGAGTVEYLVGQDGTISFLEVNTRLQVEHPVSEETAGLDLVREQFRIADGLPLTITSDPVPRGHAFEFRINGEDAGRGFLPAPGVVSALTWPSGPGVRVDAGVETGSVIGGNFDSMLAKIIVVGATREEALERSRRALDETVIEGIATVLPFHRLVVRDPAFTSSPFTVHTRWIETQWSNTVDPFTATADAGESPDRETVVVEVGGKRLEVTLPASLGTRTTSATKGPAKRTKTGHAGTKNADASALTAPMQGTIVKVAAQDGDTVAEGDVIIVIEAMKMEQPLTAHRAGTVSGLSVEVGATVTAGATVCTID
jgi:acetyl-CoA/propionyl-CoA carboxylase biotin carboxyl carrier protein